MKATTNSKCEQCAHAEEILIPLAHSNIRITAPKSQDESGPRISFWWGMTTSSVALALQLEAMRDLNGISVMELGCGLGLSGISAGLSGAGVLFTDYVPRALEFSRKNCFLNGLDVDSTNFRILDWENPGDLNQVDMVIGSEILYDYFLHGSLIELLNLVLKPNGTIILADRKRMAISRFIGRLINSGFRCSETVSEIGLAGFPKQTVSIFKLVRDTAGL